MLFNSYEFILVYLPVTLWGFFALGARSPRLAQAWLAAASLAFYAWWDWRYVGLLLASILGNFLAGRLIGRAREGGNHRLGRVVLAAAIAANLALLAVYKYADFTIESLRLAGVAEWSFLDIALPLGISFFTFTQIAFLVDVHRGHAQEYRVVPYGLFVTYFPHLIAGPVLHHKEMMPQFGQDRIYRPDWEMIAAGLAIFTLGLFKKVMIADRLAPFATSVFSAAKNGVELTMAEAWGGALAYTLQIYFDFSGYSEMAIGLSAMLGIRLPVNFLSPYKSGSIVEFWRLWHITLSRFLRDYLYIPLGGSRRGKARQWTNLMVTMLLGGLWHGAGWTFVIWGGLHGLFLLLNHAWNDMAAAVRARWGWRPRLGVVPARLLTFAAVVVAWVFFRAETLDGALAMLSAMIGGKIVSLPSSLAFAGAFLPFDARFDGMFLNYNGKLDWQEGVLLILAGLAVVHLAPNLAQIFGRAWPALPLDGAVPARASRLSAWPLTKAKAAALGLVLLGCLVSLAEISEFLYFQF